MGKERERERICKKNNHFLLSRLLSLQVDPRCVIQYLHWYHEDAATGEVRMLKTSKNSNDPYVHTIERVTHDHLGR